MPLSAANRAVESALVPCEDMESFPDPQDRLQAESMMRGVGRERSSVTSLLVAAVVVALVAIVIVVLVIVGS